MTWPQLITILLTGSLAMAASAVGQYVGGRMAREREERERAHRERDRFSESKRELYLQSLNRISSLEPISFDDRIGIMMSLSLYDPAVAAKFSNVVLDQHRVASQIGSETEEAVREIVADAATGALSDPDALKEATASIGKRIVNKLRDSRPALMETWLAGVVELGEVMRSSLGVTSGGKDPGKWKISVAPRRTAGPDNSKS
jgi:hypothetical protein